MFLNSVVRYTDEEPKIPVVCSNKLKLGLHPRHKGEQTEKKTK